MSSLAESLATGTRLHQAGQLAEAEQIYRQILAIEPRHPHALHQLGMVAMQARRFEAAVELIGAAIEVDAGQVAFYANLAEAYRHLGRLDEAIGAARQALTVDPQLAQAHVLLGNLLGTQGKFLEAVQSFEHALQRNSSDVWACVGCGQALGQLNRQTDAERQFRRALVIEPRNVDALFGLAGALHAQERLGEAADLYRATLEIQPDHAEALNNLGTIFKAQERNAEAIAYYQQAVKVRPDYAIVHYNLAALYQDEGQMDAALESCRAALACDPDMILAHSAMGKIYQRRGRLDEATAAYLEVLRRDPDNASAYVDMGNVHQARGEGAKAFECYQEAIRRDPDYAFAYSNIGATLSEEGLRDQAIAYCRRAIEIDPNFAIAHGNLAVALQAIGRYDESMTHHRLAIECDPSDAGLHGNLLYLLNYEASNDVADVFAEHCRWGARHADPLTARSRLHTNDRTPGRKLRVGYVSGHFMAHAVNFFVEPILASHDHDRFEVYCYSNVSVDDEVTDRLRGYADGWRRIRELSDEQAAEQVREDQIDILVDLSGHIGGNRLLVFAHKPAPVQVTYIGYQCTTGMRAMDYRLTDAFADPPGETDAYYTEKLVRLPRSFFCYLPSSDAPAVVPPPAVANGYVTFGSFNNMTKVRPEVLQTWAEVMQRAAGSRLIILADMAESLKSYLIETFAALGISTERLELAHRRPRSGYLELIQRADVALDPFPFNGHTTTCDALWQGLPVVARCGSQYVSRFGCSGLITLGLNDLVASSAEQYADIATGLAHDVDRLVHLRSTLRERMASSPLLDFVGFTRNLEDAYQAMWLQWCSRPPA